MTITIPLNGTFNLTIKWRRVGTGGYAIAGVTLISGGGTEHDLIWAVIFDPILNTTYQLNITNLTLNNTDLVNPAITSTGTYNGVGSAWNGYSGSPVEIGSGEFSDGAWFAVYAAKTGILEDRTNTISKTGELVVTPAAGGTEIVDWNLY